MECETVGRVSDTSDGASGDVLTDTRSLREEGVLGEKLDSALGRKLEMHIRHSSRYSEKPKFDNASLEF